ncbi:DUF6196 family protein [Plantactinospora sp. WMMB782]|uniref:DUF6196 family protein n=1 Tax=Plantactinospora sp. WMMB782 TaxID=3404121 RepID=UPI003B949130
MVSISLERHVETERRLRAVLRTAQLVHLPGTWCFQRVAGGDVPVDALAMVRDADGWCALLPATDDVDERFGLTSSTFAPGIDNSGYVGWLATAVKQRLGSGVFVICGDNPHRGGIFDYLGYPAEVAGQTRALMDELRTPVDTDPLALDLQVFEVVETSAASAISRATVFEFREHDGMVEASYAGGQIVRGTLLGRREHDRLSTAYAQVGAGGERQTGTATMRVRLTESGQLLLTEDYTWSDGTTGRNVLRSLRQPHAA